MTTYVSFGNVPVHCLNLCLNNLHYFPGLEKQKFDKKVRTEVEKARSSEMHVLQNRHKIFDEICTTRKNMHKTKGLKK